MQHSNCYSNVKNIDYKFEYGGYLMVKLDLVYKNPFSFYVIEVSNPHPTLTHPLRLFWPPTHSILPNVPTPLLLGAPPPSPPLHPVYSGPKSNNFISLVSKNISGGCFCCFKKFLTFPGKHQCADLSFW